MIVGLIQPLSGQILLDGADITDMPMYQRSRKGIGYLSQEPSIFRKLSVEDNIMAILETLPLSPRLTADLLAWARRWEELRGHRSGVLEEGSYASWVTSGRRLSRDLQLELGPAYDVEYAHDHEG